jgi:peptidoglycan glycosyltransferase
VNGPIIRLFGVVVVLFALLVVWTSRWTVFQATSLANNPLNRRTLVDDLKIKRGQILADDGSTVLARSVPGPDGTWTRTYPTSSLFAQPVGYLIAVDGRAAGLERSRGPELRGLQTGLSSVFGQFNSERVGDDVYTTLDPKAQQLAVQQLAGQAGSVVALDTQTGAVRVMYANPGYDNNNPPTTGPGTTFNRSTQASYPPGSTFKVVTAAAAIDSGRYTPSSTVNGDSPKTISGVPLSNDGNKSWGNIDLTTALTYSVNTVWAQVAEALGRPTMTDYMKRFGFYAKPPIDLPPPELNASQPYTSGRHPHPFPPASPDEDIGRIGIGQGGLLVTPLQMAMVAAAVANGGTLMAPRLTDKVVDQTGRTIETIKPAVYSQVMKPSTAQQLTQMMQKVVEEGTGTAAQLPSGVAGKTGTAEVGTQGSNLTQPWFIGFAPINNPKVAVAVTVERTQGGFGGTVAAPIAAQIIQTLLSEGR